MSDGLYESLKMEGPRAEMILPLLNVTKPFLSDSRAPTIQIPRKKGLVVCKFACLKFDKVSVSVEAVENHEKIGLVNQKDLFRQDINIRYLDAGNRTAGAIHIPIMPRGQLNWPSALLMKDSSSLDFEAMKIDWEKGNTLTFRGSMKRNMTVEELNIVIQAGKQGEFNDRLTNITLDRLISSNPNIITADKLLKSQSYEK